MERFGRTCQGRCERRGSLRWMVVEEKKVPRERVRRDW
jgi:hypothetical protein